PGHRDDLEPRLGHDGHGVSSAFLVSASIPSYVMPFLVRLSRLPVPTNYTGRARAVESIWNGNRELESSAASAQRALTQDTYAARPCRSGPGPRSRPSCPRGS